MATTKYEHITVILKSILSINVINCSQVRRASRVNWHQKVDGHADTRAVELIRAERLGPSAEVRLANTAQKLVGIYDLINLDVYLVVSIVGEI